MYTRVFEVKTSGQNSPRTDLGVHEEDPSLGLASCLRKHNFFMMGTSPRRGLGSRRAKIFYGLRIDSIVLEFYFEK